MRYLSKTESSRVLAEGWQYARANDRPQIRDALLEEQSHFCAYSERFIEHIDAVDIEHFDPRLKGTDRDSYWNWYAVLHWMNQHKARRIEANEPLPQPHDASLRVRIRYVDGFFFAVDDADIEATNLIRYLGFNKPEVWRDRKSHVRRILDLRDRLAMTPDEFVEWLCRDPKNLSFLSALEAELKCSLSPSTQDRS